MLRGLTLAVAAGEVLCLMGRNGAGKSTALKAIMGLVRATAGEIRLDATRLDGLPAHQVPAPRRRLGAAGPPPLRRAHRRREPRDRPDDPQPRPRHPRARPRPLPAPARAPAQVSGTLSGGEQQMLAIARALCTEPKVLLLDEPTEGLQPSMIALIRDTIAALKATGVATILVEQRVDAALAVADRIAFMADGTRRRDRSRRRPAPDAPQFRAYVGV